MNQIYKNILVLLIAFTWLSAKAQTRQVNFSYKIVSPIPYDEFSSPQKIPITFRLYNHGPDTLWTCDTFVSYIVHSLGMSQDSNIYTFSLAEPIFPNDSSKIYFDTSYVNWDGPGARTSLTLNLQVANIATDYTHEKGSLLQAKDTGGNQKIWLIHKKNTAFLGKVKGISDIVVYPNPTSEGVVTIKNLDVSSVKNLDVIDINGRSVDFIRTLNSQSIELNLASGLSGLFVIIIQTEMGVVSKRIIVSAEL